MTRYPAYRDSGVEWLGEVPEGWTIVPVKAVATCNDEVLTEDTDPGWEIEYLEISGVDAFAGITETSKVPFGNAASRARRRVKDGDILVSTVRTYLRAIAQVIEPPQNMIASTGFAVLRPRSVGSRFLGYLFRSEILIGKIIARSVGVSYPAINASDIMSLPIPLPPLPEQTAIAAFLDVETAKIDGLVAEQRRLIDLLREKRQAVISHAVTRGLNPHAKLVDTGVAWIPTIPAHWDRVTLGKLCKQVSDGPHFSPNYVDEGVMFISARNISVDRWSLDDAKYISEDDYAEFSKRVVPIRGDVLYTKGGTTGVARVVDFDERFQVWVHVAVLRLFSEMANPFYVAYALNSTNCYEQSQLHTRGATNQDLGLTRMTKIWLALPPLAEQQSVVAELDRICAKLDTLTVTAESAVALLQERRAALISAAVTGKIDVRGRVPQTGATKGAQPA